MSNYPLGPWSRSEGSIVNSTLYRVRTYVTTNGGPYTDSTAVAVPNGTSKQRSGFNSGPDHSTPRSASLTQDIRTLVRPWSGRASNVNPKYYYEINGAPWRPGDPLGSFDDNSLTSGARTISQVKDLAFKKFIGKQGSRFTGLVFAGEFPEMVDTCRDILNRASGAHNDAYQSLVKNLIKRKKGSITDIAKEIADHNLGLQFAILPSVNDLKNLAISIQDKVVNDDYPVRTVQASFSERSSAVKQYTSNQGGMYCTLKNRAAWFRLAKVGAQLIQDIPEKPEWVNDLNYFGVSPEMIIPAAWELTPYSWLVDYFANVGDLLELAALRRGIWKNGWSVTIDQTSTECTCTPTRWADTYYSRLSGSVTGLYTREQFAFNRSPFDPDSYVPSLRVRLPNLQQSANVLSLATKKFMRSPISQVYPGKLGKKIGVQVNRILRG